ncbi:MAG: hypothetical protein AB7V56_13285 [Candidatus Nitrosocosmicus sp.]
MNNQNIKISDIINGDERQDHKKVEEGDKRRLSETVKIDVSDCTRIKRSTVIILENRFEYDRLKELLDAVMYQKKLMNCYGLDTINSKWDLRNFPVTTTDTQMEGIQSDIQKYNETIRQYNEYSKHLGLEYGVDIVSEMKKGCKIIFRHPIKRLE